MNLKLAWLGAAALSALGALAVPAAADYPNKPIRLIIPFGQGGATDTVGRMIATPLEQALGQSVIVVNQPGAGGAVGIASMVQARPDGYTLAMGANDSLSTRPLITESGYTLDNIEPVALVAGGPIGLAVRGDSPIKSLDDLAALMKSGAQVTFSSPGVGTGPHLAAERFVKAAAGKAAHVPAESVGASMVKLLSGEVTFVSGTGSNFPARIGETAEGIRVLGMFDEARWSRLPEIPTGKEQGYDIVALQWFGIVAPKGTPADAVKRLAGEIEKILNAPDAEEMLSKFHFSNLYAPPERLGALMYEEAEVLKPLLGELGMLRK
jgi:tripartite-type tricarboxylate transporter receptor subunit TctC